MAAPICATSLTGASRSSRAISEFLQRRGNGERRQRTIKAIAPGIFHEQAGLQHRLGQFLDKQRDAIRLVDDLRHHFAWQLPTDGHLFDQSARVLPVKPIEPQQADIGKTRPGRLELGPEGHEREYRQAP